MAKETMKEMLKMIDAKINHIEDVSADNRALIVKLIKQNNSIVKFLSELSIELEEMPSSYTEETYSKLSNEQLQNSEKLKSMLEEFMDKHSELKEFEDELKKHKDKLTPGQIGES